MRLLPIILVLLAITWGCASNSASADIPQASSPEPSDPQTKSKLKYLGHTSPNSKTNSFRFTADTSEPLSVQLRVTDYGSTGQQVTSFTSEPIIVTPGTELFLEAPDINHAGSAYLSAADSSTSVQLGKPQLTEWHGHGHGMVFDQGMLLSLNPNGLTEILSQTANAGYPYSTPVTPATMKKCNVQYLRLFHLVVTPNERVPN